MKKIEPCKTDEMEIEQRLNIAVTVGLSTDDRRGMKHNENDGKI
jgi:hypothetical protein